MKHACLLSYHPLAHLFACKKMYERVLGLDAETEHRLSMQKIVLFISLTHALLLNPLSFALTKILHQ